MPRTTTRLTTTIESCAAKGRVPAAACLPLPGIAGADKPPLAPKRCLATQESLIIPDRRPLVYGFQAITRLEARIAPGCPKEDDHARRDNPADDGGNRGRLKNNFPIRLIVAITLRVMGPRGRGGNRCLRAHHAERDEYSPKVNLRSTLSDSSPMVITPDP